MPFGWKLKNSNHIDSWLELKVVIMNALSTRYLLSIENSVEAVRVSKLQTAHCGEQKSGKRGNGFVSLSYQKLSKMSSTYSTLGQCK